MIKFCQNCKNKNIINYSGVGGYYWTYLHSAKTCNECGNEFENIDFPELDLKVLTQISQDISFIEAMIKLKQDNIIEYEIKMSQFRNQLEQQKSNKTQNDTTPQCPTCGSTNIEKISLTKKAVGGAMFGLFSSNVRNTMHCNNCGAKW